VQYTYTDYLGTSRTVSPSNLTFNILIKSPCNTSTFNTVTFVDSANSAFSFSGTSGAPTLFTDGESFTYKFPNKVA